jgi:aldose 1-epimerase
MESRVFGSLDGEPIYEVAIRCARLEARIISWGAVLRELCAPAAEGTGERHFVLGLCTLEDYLTHSRHFGAIAGRFANRIAHGRFELDGTLRRLPLNDHGKHSLHGGGAGFGRRPWRLAAHDASAATLSLVSPDGDNGYPGTVFATCTYRLLEPATLRIELTAIADAPTPLNLAPHSYFNLDGSPDIRDHELDIAADFYTPVDEEGVPTGEITPVHSTQYDFRTPRSLRLLDSSVGGVRYDINFVLRQPHVAVHGVRSLQHAATLRAPSSDVSLELWTTAPGLQLYDGHKLDVPVPGLAGVRYGRCAGLCLEPQYFPDSPNHPNFPNTILRPGTVFQQVTEYRFDGPPLRR